MKKLTFFAVAAALLCAGCNNDDNGETPKDPTKLVYGGVTYNLITLADGNTWMAENLRYIPEGKTVSDDPTDATTGIWYPYTFDGTNCVAATDDASVSKLGLLYNAVTAFNIENISADNSASVSGIQGICPDGWHIPTFEELLNLVGKSSKLSAAAVGGWEVGSTPENKNAIFYNEDYDGGNIALINETGFNFVFCGCRNGAGSGSYIKPSAAYPTMPMTYIWGSTVYNPAATTIQFMSLMSTATATYADGRLTVAFNNNTNGCAVRCVKNK
ncbi:MAG: FISUMP domain-containing protein [Alistipes sp.]